MSVMMIQSGRFASAEFSPLDLSPALWIDPSDAATVTISGSSGAYIGPNGLVCPGLASDNGASTPNVSAHNITGDIDIIVKVTATDWTPAADMALVAKDTSTRNWNFYLVATTGKLGFYWFNAAASITDVQSSVGTGITDGTAKWVRVTIDVDNGAGGTDVKFYLSDDGTSWTQLGTTSTGGSTTDIRSTTDYLTCGFRPTGNRLGGTIHRAIVKSGIDGTTVFDADFENATPYVSAFTESALGAPVYVVSSTATSATANYTYIGPEGLVRSGTGANRASSPHSTALRMSGDQDWVARIKLPIYGAPGFQTILGKSNDDGHRWWAVVSTTGRLRLDWRDSGGTQRKFNQTVASPFTNGVAYWVKASIDVDNGSGGSAVSFYYAADQATEPSSWTLIETVTVATTSGLMDTTETYDLGIGSIPSNAYPLTGTIYRAMMKNGIGGTVVFDADFESAPDYAPSFTESSSNAATVTITATNTPANAAGALVSQIDDKSGNARHLTQGTAANMPKYWNGRNGNNCLVFDGSNDFIDLATTPTINQPIVHAVVMQTRAPDTNASVIGDVSSPQPATFVDANLYGLYAGTVLTGGAANTLPHVMVNTFNGASSSIRVDGTQVAAGDGGSSGNSATKIIRLGANSATVSRWNGLIAEVVVVPSTLATPSDIETYLKNRWGTP